MNRQVSALAAAIAATLGTASVTQGATAVATLTGVISYSGNGSSAGNITSSTATFEYDDVTHLLTQTGGTFNVRFTTAPTTTLFRHSITGLVLGNGAAAAASTYACTEGNFGSNVGASLCGNYSFGANFVNDSTATWGPGTAFARTIGGDDMALGAQQNLAAYDNFTQLSWSGTTLTLSNASCNPVAPGGANNCSGVGGFNTGYKWELNATQSTPTAVDDADSTTRNVARIVPVLANDLNISDPVTITADAAGTNVQASSTIVVAGSGGPGAGVTVTYTPNLAAGLAGPITDTFDYTVNGETATVTMTIDNLVPNAVGGDVAISTVGVAPDGLTGSFTAPGTGGSLGDSGAATPTNGGRGNATIAGNTITYTVTDDTFFTGTDSFTYSISDPDGAGPAETSGPVTVNVTIADASPSLNPAAAETNLNTPVAVNLVLNAGNGSPAQHTFDIATDAASGGCAVDGAGTVTYTPDAGFTGNDSCVASVTDGDGDTAQATVSVEVVDLLPVLNDASTETRRDTAVAVDLSFTLGDGTLAQHSFALVTDASNGSCTVDGAGTLTYTPNAGYTGSDSCVVSLTDVNASQDQATVNINVTSGSGLRENDGGSSADWLILSLLGGSALIRRRRRS